MIRSWRTAMVVLGAAAVAVVAFAGPAAADVTVTPSEATRGGPAKLVFTVPEERPGAYTAKVELLAPEATPIAEIYPLSVDDWAPMMTMRDLAQPVEGIHGGSLSQATAAVTWTRTGGMDANPPKPAVLSVALGPMPQADRVVFTVVQTYSDGTVVRWADLPAADGARPKNPALVIKLVAEQAPGGTDAGVAAAATTPSGGDGSSGILIGGLVMGLVAGVGVSGWVLYRTRRAPVPVKASPPRRVKALRQRRAS